MEYLPPYAPEVNPMEYIGSYWKLYELLNVCPKAYRQLSEGPPHTAPNAPSASIDHRLLESSFFWPK